MLANWKYALQIWFHFLFLFCFFGPLAKSPCSTLSHLALLSWKALNITHFKVKYPTFIYDSTFVDVLDVRDLELQSHSCMCCEWRRIFIIGIMRCRLVCPKLKYRIATFWDFWSRVSIVLASQHLDYCCNGGKMLRCPPAHLITLWHVGNGSLMTSPAPYNNCASCNGRALALSLWLDCIRMPADSLNKIIALVFQFLKTTLFAVRVFCPKL